MIYNLLKDGIVTEINGGELYSHPSNAMYKFVFPMCIDGATIKFNNLEYIVISDTYKPEHQHIVYAMCMIKDKYNELLKTPDIVTEDTTYEDLKKILGIEEIPIYNELCSIRYLMNKMRGIDKS